MVAGNEREIGELSGRMAAVERTAERLERKLDANSHSTDEILRRIAGLDGGWKTLIAVAAFVSALIGLGFKFIPFLAHLG